MALARLRSVFLLGHDHAVPAASIDASFVEGTSCAHRRQRPTSTIHRRTLLERLTKRSLLLL
tara:strand:- start:242 stop:427 length:186 start_codon:yes stop_codon:yes gene_type:complete